MIERPVKAHANLQRKTSTLFFRDGSFAEYYMIGAVCWPMTYEDAPGIIDNQGFLVMAGKAVGDGGDGVVTLFEQHPFVVVDNVLKGDGTIEFPGIASTLNRIWAQYYADRYYFHQDYEHSRTYRLEVLRSEMTKPKPKFIEIPWASDDEARHTIWRYVKLKRIRIDKDSEMARQLSVVKAGAKDTTPAVHALQCLLMGLERFPWRKPKEA